MSCRDSTRAAQALRNGIATRVPGESWQVDELPEMLARVTAQGTAIRLLGRISIDRAGAASPAAFPGRRSELVFAYLAAEHRRDVSRDELADALWPQELPGAWAAALRGVVSEVRRVIAAGGLDAGELLERSGGGYRLRLPADAVLDLDDARAAVATARARVDDEPAVAARAADHAAELARLPFLPRHEGDWVDGVRRELDGILVEALELSARPRARGRSARGRGRRGEARRGGAIQRCGAPPPDRGARGRR